MPPLELLDNFLQLLVAATGSLWSLWLFRKNKQTVFAFLCSGLMCWALGLVFWLLYAFLRGYSPLEPSPANFAWIGSLLCLTSIGQALAGPEEKRWYPPLAFLAPLITIIFAIAWFVEMEYASPWVNTFWCLAFLSLSWVSFRGFLYAFQHKQRYPRHLSRHCAGDGVFQRDDAAYLPVYLAGGVSALQWILPVRHAGHPDPGADDPGSAVCGHHGAPASQRRLKKT